MLRLEAPSFQILRTPAPMVDHSILANVPPLIKIKTEHQTKNTLSLDKKNKKHLPRQRLKETTLVTMSSLFAIKNFQRSKKKEWSQKKRCNKKESDEHK